MVNARKTDPAMPLMTMFTIIPIGGRAPWPAFCSSSRLRGGCCLTGLLSVKRSPDARQHTVEMRVQPARMVDGLTIEAAGLRHLPDAYLSAIERDGDTLVAVGAEQVLRETIASFLSAS